MGREGGGRTWPHRGFRLAAGVKVGRGRNNSFSLRDSASLFQCPRPYSQSPLSLSRGLWPDRLNKCQRLFPRKFDTLCTGEPRSFYDASFFPLPFLSPSLTILFTNWYRRDREIMNLAPDIACIVWEGMCGFYCFLFQRWCLVNSIIERKFITDPFPQN